MKNKFTALLKKSGNILFVFTGLSLQFSFIVIPHAKHRFVVIAHRGDHTHAPENTIRAYKNAIRIKVDYVEIDLRITKDSQLVIMHDESLKRMTGIDRKISELTLNEIKTLWIVQPDHPEWGKHRIPTFEDVMNICKGRTNIYLDLKNAAASLAYKKIVEAGMERNVIVYINTMKQFQDWRMHAPQMPLMISLPPYVKNPVQLNAMLDDINPDLLDGRFESYSDAMLETARARKMIIWPDIQSADENKNWDKALTMGFTGLQTDHPKELIMYLKAKKLR